MEPRIENSALKRMVGKRMKMTFSNNKTFELWRSFMQNRKEIHHCVGTELYSIQIYKPLFFNDFIPDSEFEKWAAVEVTDFETIPFEMETLNLEGGLYAVFLYRGAASAAAPTFRYILQTWLPNSEYTLDDRPHFEILGEKYKNEDPDSEEEIWIPIKPKFSQ